MKHPYLRLLLLNSLLLILINGTTQNIHIANRTEQIIIKEDSSFIRNISIAIKKSANEIIYPVFYDTELEEVSNFIISLTNGKRNKALKNVRIQDEDVDIDYISSKKVKFVLIPPELEVTIKYSVATKELMYFSNLHFFSYNEVDTLKYQVKVPEAFHFAQDLIYSDSLTYLNIDSLKVDGFLNWNIEAIPKKIEPNQLMFFGIYKNMKLPLMRTIVVPAAYKNRERQYLNDWYLHNAETRRGLNDLAKLKIDTLTNGIVDPYIIVDTLYNYVKTHFKYVAIEIGMGAFIPSHVNDVFLNKQGDCKDLSNFLCDALNYKGIKSDVALAATFHHISDCDFPSLASANHVICVAYIDDKPIILDPTVSIHIPETPVESIQERFIFIINSKGGEFYKVNSLAHQNKINYEIELNVDTDKALMEGAFNAKYEGITGNFMKRTFIDNSPEEMNAEGLKHFSKVFNNQSIKDINIRNHKRSIEAEGRLTVKGKIFSDDNSRYLFLDFLPPLIEHEDRETLLEGTHLGSTIHKNVIMTLKMDKPFNPFTTIEHPFSNEGVSLKVEISSPTNFIIVYKYEFILDHIHIEKENIDLINEILKSFKKIANEPIILKNHS